MYDQTEKAYDAYDGAVESTERRQTHVESEVNEQSQVIAAIQQAVTELQKRLGGVLRSEDDAEKAIGNPHPILVPLAESLYDSNGKLRGIHYRLVSVLDRLEL